MLRPVLAATLLLLLATLLVPAPAAADTCAGVSPGPDDSAGACVGNGYVLVYRCTFINCIAARVPVPPLT